MAAIDPEISKAFHDIRNTYQSLLYHFDDVDAEGFKVDPAEAIARMNKDLALMKEAEQAIRESKRCHLYIDYRKDCQALKDQELSRQGIDPGSVR
jgi:hypothetical protein